MGGLVECRRSRVNAARSKWRTPHGSRPRLQGRLPVHEEEMREARPVPGVPRLSLGGERQAVLSSQGKVRRLRKRRFLTAREEEPGLIRSMLLSAKHLGLPREKEECRSPGARGRLTR